MQNEEQTPQGRHSWRETQRELMNEREMLEKQQPEGEKTKKQ